MRISSILSLPTSILVLLASQTISAEEEARSPLRGQEDLVRRRDVEELLRLGRNPVGVRKMGLDEGEKFFMEYWQFDENSEKEQALLFESQLRTRDEDEEAKLLANVSAAISFRPPFALHTQFETQFKDLKVRDEGSAVLALLKRDFVCPTGTAACSSIGYPNSCCSTDETCFVIQDTGLGPVGCCPNGATCGGTITSCNSPNTPCADDLGGGCCIPNYVCEGVGCVIGNSVTTIIVTETFTAFSQTFVQTSTSVSTIVVSTATTTSPSPIHPTSTTTTIVSPTSATGVAPVRPTSITTTATVTTSTGTSADSCPTGFYACDAFYGGGCCRTGRNCQTTSCPATSSTTIISSGVTVVVPVGSAATVNSPTGACASGWATCAASDGGNCCPSGYSCGTASCSSISASSTAVAQKESPSRGVRTRGCVEAALVMSCFVVALVLL